MPLRFTICSGSQVATMVEGKRSHEALAALTAVNCRLLVDQDGHRDIGHWIPAVLGLWVTLSAAGEFLERLARALEAMRG